MKVEGAQERLRLWRCSGAAEAVVKVLRNDGGFGGAWRSSGAAEVWRSSGLEVLGNGRGGALWASERDCGARCKGMAVGAPV